MIYFVGGAAARAGLHAGDKIIKVNIIKYRYERKHKKLC